MLFPTHLLVGYLLGRRWTGRPAWAAVGAALPDLIDKPLGWAGATTLYQTAGHSALSLLALSALAVLFARPERPAPEVVAAGVGWGSHLALDVLGMALDGRPENWVLVLWPLATKPTPTGLGPVAYYLANVPSPSLYAEVAAWIAGAYVLAGSRGWTATR